MFVSDSIIFITYEYEYILQHCDFIISFKNFVITLLEFCRRHIACTI